jgi:hypothetical protein
MKRDRPTTSRTGQKTSERELRRRIAAFRARVNRRIAGPDSPIYKGGLQMTAVRFTRAPSPEKDDT